MKKLILMTALMLGTSACHTIVLKNGADASTEMNHEQWHHIGIIRLVEYSKPVDFNQFVEMTVDRHAQTGEIAQNYNISYVDYLSLPVSVRSKPMPRVSAWW
mgnify:CR=1 FL=1